MVGAGRLGVVPVLHRSLSGHRSDQPDLGADHPASGGTHLIAGRRLRRPSIGRFSVVSAAGDGRWGTAADPVAKRGGRPRCDGSRRSHQCGSGIRGAACGRQCQDGGVRGGTAHPGGRTSTVGSRDDATSRFSGGSPRYQWTRTAQGSCGRNGGGCIGDAAGPGCSGRCGATGNDPGNCDHCQPGRHRSHRDGGCPDARDAVHPRPGPGESR